MAISEQRSAELARVVADLEASPERDQIQARTTEYADARRRRLDDLSAAADALADGADPSRWRAPAEGLRDDCARTLGALLSGISSPSPAGAALQYRLQAEEAAFHGPLADLPAPARWAAALAVLREVRDLDASLKARWDALRDKAADVDRQQAAAAARLKDGLTRAVADSRDRARDAADKLRAAAADLARQKDASDAPDWHATAGRGADDAFAGAARVLQTLSDDARAWRTAVDAARQDLTQLGWLQQAETEVVHRLFRESRDEATRFASSPPPDRARALLQEAADALSRWASSQATPALGSDAAALARDLTDRARRILDQIQSAWDDLRRNHDGRFLGTPSSETTEALLHPSAWNDRRAGLADLPQGIGALRDQATVFYGADLDAPYQALRVAVGARLDAREHKLQDLDAAERARDDRFAGARQQLFQYAATDSDFDALVLDYFHDAMPAFYDGITRSEKMNVTMERYGADAVLARARECWEKTHPFDANDMPTRKGAYPVSDSDREVLIRTLKTDADLDALALDFFPRAFLDYTGTMTRRQKAAILLAQYGASTVLARAQEEYGKLHPFDERDLPTMPKYPVTESDRDWLLDQFPLDSDFNAFLLDYFYSVQLDTTGRMPRRQKAGLLIATVGMDTVRAKLAESRQNHPS